MKTALCPSCMNRCASAAANPDGLCDDRRVASPMPGAEAAAGGQAAPAPAPRPTPGRPPMVEGKDWIATGNFDGTSCGSDADPGL